MKGVESCQKWKVHDCVSAYLLEFALLVVATTPSVSMAVEARKDVEHFKGSELGLVPLMVYLYYVHRLKIESVRIENSEISSRSA